jgi:hypothetical protein
MTIDELKDFLRSGVADVTFTKVSDGTERTVDLTLSPALIPPLNGGHTYVRPSDLVTAWSPSEQSWKCFYFENFVSAKFVAGAF